MRFCLSVVLILLCSAGGAARAESAYMVDERPCPDQDPALRPPRPGEWCDYVTKIKSCHGDLAERVFRQTRAPSYLVSEVGVEHPRRLICHQDQDD